ncbi:MAG: hypothetical protein C4519_12195 [Desulfobacteraceae bacterium]|nr:MAG: hypothetical protein C4519_12195 [Desulfobacteraceae bacterium]
METILHVLAVFNNGSMEQFWTYMPAWIDALLIAPFRWPADALTGFWLGAFILAMHCVVLGELTLSVAIRLNRRHIMNLKVEIAEREALSIQAYHVGDRAGYKALNQQANDAWGRHFFTMAAYSAGMLWPVAFGLAWMQGRFQAVEFALPWPLSAYLVESVGYPFIFIPLYIVARILFGRVRRWLPYFRGVQKMLDGKE